MERSSDPLRWMLAIYFLAFLGVVFVWRYYRFWRQTGASPMGSDEGAYGLTKLLFSGDVALLAAITAIHMLSEEGYRFLTPIEWLEQPALVSAGLVLLALVFPWVCVAQSQMGRSWRIGIDPAARTELVQRGLFRISRNPIFLGIQGTLVGFFLVLPNAWSLLMVGLGIALLQIQVRLEEEYLAQAQGEDYLEYCRRVRRWL